MSLWRRETRFTRKGSAGVSPDLLEARVRNKGKPTFTTDEVRKELGLT